MGCEKKCYTESEIERVRKKNKRTKAYKYNLLVRNCKKGLLNIILLIYFKILGFLNTTLQLLSLKHKKYIFLKKQAKLKI